MVSRRALAVAALLGLGASCSLVTSFDGLGSGGAGGGSSTTSSATSSASGTGGTGGGGGSMDASMPDAGGKCVQGGYYCGGDKVVGNADTLYQCVDDAGTAKSVMDCGDAGCVIRLPPNDDMCLCHKTGLYCGGDKLVGDPGKLYRCTGHVTGTLVDACGGAGCVVVDGDDDHCKN